MTKILIIDDEQLLRQAIGDYFEDDDYEVVLSGDGQEGLEMFRAEKPDAIIVDLNMPRVDGFKVVETVTKESPETPIIVISGVGIVGDAIRAVRLGAWDFLTKPMNDLEILSYTMDKAFDRANLLRENREYKEELEDKVRLRTAQLQETNESLQNTQLQILHTLALAGEFKDYETSGHVIRVSKYSQIVAEALGLSQDKVGFITKASPLHDIGKIAITESVLLKTSQLQKAEWDEMMEHCQYGFNLLTTGSPGSTKISIKEKLVHSLQIQSSKELKGQLLSYASNIALFHHEKWDGSGYPSGLVKEDIPVEARITALVDVYDALGSKRPYKQGYSEDKCQSIIQELSGSHFDPKMVSAFFKSIDHITQIKQKWKE
jgi:cyclic di-GMP phosphodiesterase